MTISSLPNATSKDDDTDQVDNTEIETDDEDADTDTDSEDTEDESDEDETEDESENGAGKDGFKAITSQEALDAIVKKRLARATRQYGDYEAVKKDAEAWRAHKKSNQTDEERTNEEKQELQTLRDEVKALRVDKVRSDVIRDLKVPASLAPFITGETQEEMEEKAELLLAALPKGATPPPSDQPKPRTKQSKNTDTDDVFDPKAVVASIPRG